MTQEEVMEQVKEKIAKLMNDPPCSNRSERCPTYDVQGHYCYGDGSDCGQFIGYYIARGTIIAFLNADGTIPGGLNLTELIVGLLQLIE